MKKAFFLLLIMVLVHAPGLRAQDAAKPFVHCIVLDKTKSMIGRDGTKQGTTNIWDDVQNYCCGMIDGFSPSSTVVFYTFDKGLYGPDVFEIKGESDKTAIKDKVRNVTVDGNYTWIASNLDKVIKSVYKQYPDHNVMIYLLTDGIEEQQPCIIQKVIDGYKGYVGDYDHLYYVDLRGLLEKSTNPTAKDFKDAFEKGDHTDIISGRPEIVNISTMYKTVSHEIKKGEENANKFKVTQRFQVTSGKLTKDFSFEVAIPDGAVNGVNFDITPSRLSVSNMVPVKNEEGKYSVEFEIENVNNVSLFDCQIPVQIKGCTGEKTLCVQPSSFIIEVKKEIEPEPEPEPESKDVTLSPLFPSISYTLSKDSISQKTFTVEQRFKVTEGELTNDFSFEVLIGDQKGLNLTINPSWVTIESSKMTPVNDEKGVYKVEFTVTKNNDNVKWEKFTANVQLKGSTGLNKVIISPDSFNIDFKIEQNVIIIKKDFGNPIKR